MREDPGTTETIDMPGLPPAESQPVPAETRAVPSPAPAAGNDEVTLQLAFSGDCWTEVSDAAGRRLFFDLGKEGRTVTLRGRAPLQVLIGNDQNVVLNVNGSPYSTSGAERRGNTARFTINQR
jgi:cytoskeleton protein RodZ